MATQVGSTQWYNEMTGKLKVVTNEIHVGRLSMLYKINITDLYQINGLITKAMNRLNESYKKTINAFWNCTPVSTEKFDMNGLWKEFNKSLGKPWVNPLKELYVPGNISFNLSEKFKNDLSEAQKHKALIEEQLNDLQSGKINLSDVIKTFDIPHENGTVYRTHYIPYPPFNNKEEYFTRNQFPSDQEIQLEAIKHSNPVKDLLAKNFIGQDYPTYAGRTFYLYDRQALVYCHEQKGGTLIIGDCSTFITDAVTCICRNKISVEDFNKFKKIEIDTKKLHMYPHLLQQRHWSFGGAVWETKRITELTWSERRLNGSTELPCVHNPNWNNEIN